MEGRCRAWCCDGLPEQAAGQPTPEQAHMCTQYSAQLPVGMDAGAAARVFLSAPTHPKPCAQVTRMLKQLCLAYRAEGGRTIVVLTQRGKLEMEEAFRRWAVPHRAVLRGDALCSTALRQAALPWQCSPCALWVSHSARRRGG